MSKDDQRNSVNEINNLPLWLLCDISSNFKDLTKFDSEIYGVDTSHFKLLVFLISVRLSGPKLFSFKI